MQGLGDGGYTDWFSIFTSQVGTSGHNYSASGVPVGGWFGTLTSEWSGYLSYESAHSITIPLMIYEGGYYFSDGLAYPTGWQTFANTALRDSRMTGIVQIYFSNWNSQVGATSANINNWFNSTNPYEGTTWSLLETMTQTLSPLTSAPALYQGFEAAIQ
jgi:hypothetical protein